MLTLQCTNNDNKLSIGKIETVKTDLNDKERTASVLEYILGRYFLN